MRETAELLPLVVACCQGDESAWEEFVEAFYQVARRALRTFRIPQDDERDILQEALVKLVNGGLERFRGHSEGELVLFLRQVVRREAFRFIQARSKEGPAGEGDIGSSGDSLEDIFLLNEILLKLTRQEREIFILKIEGLKEREIAEQMGLKPNTVGIRWKRIRKKISDWLRERGS